VHKQVWITAAKAFRVDLFFVVGFLFSQKASIAGYDHLGIRELMSFESIGRAVTKMIDSPSVSSENFFQFWPRFAASCNPSIVELRMLLTRDSRDNFKPSNDLEKLLLNGSRELPHKFDQSDPPRYPGYQRKHRCERVMLLVATVHKLNPCLSCVCQ
jgi:hypothetical protein